MSDSSQGLGWWRGTDDKWYPPATELGPLPPPPRKLGPRALILLLLLALAVVAVVALAV